MNEPRPPTITCCRESIFSVNPPNAPAAFRTVPTTQSNLRSTGICSAVGTRTVTASVWHKSLAACITASTPLVPAMTRHVPSEIISIDLPICPVMADNPASATSAAIFGATLPSPQPARSRRSTNAGVSTSSSSASSSNL